MATVLVWILLVTSFVYAILDSLAKTAHKVNSVSSKASVKDVENTQSLVF